MNIIFLSPHFPPNFYRFCVRLRELGVNVLGIADEHFDRLRPELREALNEYYRVESMEDYDQLLRACGYFTHRYGKIDRIDSLNEHWLQLEAQLRTDFNIPGINEADIEQIKRKSRMKQTYRNAGVPVARGDLIATIEDARRLIDEIGYPVVVKPDIGVGAAHTYRINSDEELVTFFAEKPPVEYILEEFIDGDICSFDGLTDSDGNPVFITAHQYGDGIMETVNEDRHVFYYSMREVPGDLMEMGLRTLRAFNPRSRFFHFEFFRSRQNGQIIALEVNMRPPGGLTVDMFNYANDFDIYEQWAQILVHNRFTATYERKYHCAYVGRKSSKPYAHSHEAILDHLGYMIVHHEPINSIFSPALGDFGYLIRATDIHRIHEAVAYIHELS